MSEEKSESIERIDEDLKQALMAAFGDGALDMLDEDDDFSTGMSLEEEATSACFDSERLPQQTGDSNEACNGLDNVLKRLEEASENNSSPLVRYMSELNRAIYGELTRRGADGRGESTAQRLVLFQTGGQQFALPLEDVREIRQYPAEVTALPFAPPWLRGVINLRGEVLSVTDFRTVIECDQERPRSGERIIIIGSRYFSAETALAVDQVIGIRTAKYLPDSGCPDVEAVDTKAPVLSGPMDIESVSTLFVSTAGLFRTTGIKAV